MKQKIWVGVVVVAAIAAVIVLSLRSSPSAMKTYSLRQEWIPWMGYAGEVVAIDKGFFGRDFALEVRPGGLEADPIKLVAGGADDFGVAGAERVLEGVEKGAPLVIIGTVNHRSPTVFLTLKTSGITEPSQFAGKQVGVLTGSNTEIVYRGLVAKLGIGKDVREVEISYDLPGFIAGKFDVLPAFMYDEPVTLRKQGVEFNVIDPVRYGVVAMGNVYFTRRNMIEQKAEVVQRFVEGVLRGWTYAFQNPDEAISLLGKRYPDLDTAKEKASLLEGRPFFEGGVRPLLAVHRDDVQREVDILKGIGRLEGKINVAGVTAPEFVERARHP